MGPELGWRGLVAGRAGDQEGQNSQRVQVCTMHFPEAVAGQAGGDFLGGASREERSSGKDCGTQCSWTCGCSRALSVLVMPFG